MIVKLAAIPVSLPIEAEVPAGKIVHVILDNFS